MSRIVLTIAASDPSGGAGIEADLKVFSALRVFGTSAITGITVQGPKGIERIIPTPGKELRKILQILANQVPLSAIKIGALVSSENLQITKSFLHSLKLKSVLDPLLISSTGYPLLAKSVWKDLSLLFPLVSLITPNVFEAEILSGVKINRVKDMEKAGRVLLNQGANALLIKGGHLKGVPEDFLFYQGEIRRFKKKRIKAKFHGLGCALSSAITAYLAQGFKLETAVEKAEIYLEKILASAIDLGGVKYLSHFSI